MTTTMSMKINMLSKVAGIKKCEKLFGVRIFRVIYMKIKITGNKKSMRYSSNM